jgi:hypothetical protein
MGWLPEGAFVYLPCKWGASPIKIKVMNKVQEIDRLINGYANGFITDDELEFMLDLLGA